MAREQFGSLLDIESFADVPVAVEVRLGCRPITLEAIAKLEPGSVVPLDRAAGETFDVYVGDLLFATAEVVIVEGSLAIRITDLFLAGAADESAASF
jgi:flagellar motor switch protein FliN/FliY